MIVKDNEGNNKCLFNRNEIKIEIIKFNETHFKQAFSSKEYKDKVYQKLINNTIRDKILKGKLEQSECSNKEVFQFLRLLKQNR